MGIEAATLLAAAILLAGATVGGRQSVLMAAVLVYAAVVSWIIQRDLGMLMPALGVAIGLGVLGLARMVLREMSSQDDTSERISKKIATSNKALTENIGS